MWQRLEENIQSDRRRKELLIKKVEPKVDKLIRLMMEENLTVEEAKVLLKLTTEHLNKRMNRKILDTPLKNVLRED